MKVGIVGAGRVGRSLAQMWRAGGIAVDLRGRGGGAPDGEVVLIAVPDAAIADVAAALPPGRVVLHASGASGPEILRPHRVVGCFHPLMSFPGPEIALPTMSGAAIRLSGDAEALAIGRVLAEALGARPVVVPGDPRLYHAAAVMAGNFATVLLAEAGAVLADAGVDPRTAREMLLPLAMTSLQNAVADPSSALTGPVARGDEGTIAAHRAALADREDLGALATYDAMTARARALWASRARPPR